MDGMRLRWDEVKVGSDRGRIKMDGMRSRWHEVKVGSDRGGMRSKWDKIYAE